MKRKDYKVREWISFRLSPEEYKIIYGQFNKTAHRYFSEYARRRLLEKPVVITYRNASADDFLTDMLKLKNELNAIGNNVNQSVRKIHTLDHLPEFKNWLIRNEAQRQILFQKIDEISHRINQLYELWLRK